MRGAVWSTVVWVWLGWIGVSAAQDLDTALFSRARKQTTILDEIGDRAERNAFLKLYKERNAAERRALSSKFLAEYPASWLLAEVYEIAAKACIDLHDPACAIEMGQRSLRLLPENPLLLVPLAATQFERGLLE